MVVPTEVLDQIMQEGQMVKDTYRWTLAGDMLPREELDKSLPVVHATERLGIESDLPQAERGLTILTPRNSVEIYDGALKRADCPPVVIGIPHGGEYVPQEIWDRTEMIRAYGHTVGLDVVSVSGFAPRNNEYLAVRAKVSRILVDLNRAPDDYRGNNPSGKGITWFTDLDGETPIFAKGQQPSEDEIREYVRKFYNPYYQAAHGLVGALFDRGHKQVLYVDGHSFPSYLDAPKYNFHADVPKPLFILGTRDGIPGVSPSASRELLHVFGETLEKEVPADLLDDPLVKDIVAYNTYFKGVRNVAHWGAPEGVRIPPTDEVPYEKLIPANCHAIQVETNSTAIFDRHTGRYNPERLTMLHKALYKAIAATSTAMQEMNK